MYNKNCKEKENHTLTASLV